MKHLRNLLTLVVLTLLSFTSYAQSENSIEGEYNLGKKNTIIKIVQEDDVYIGKIIASDNPKVKIGKVMLKDVKQVNSKWRGKIYVPKRKEWYDAEFTPQKNSLDIKVKVGFISKTINWKRK